MKMPIEICSASYVVERGKLFMDIYTPEDVIRMEASPKPYCFVPSTWDVESSYSENVEMTDLRTIDTNESVKRYIFPIPAHVKTFRENIERFGRRTYEADIPYVKRWMIDNALKCSSYENTKAYWDIEVMDEKGFPDMETAEEPIISITVKKDGSSETFQGEENYIIRSFIEYLKKEKVRMLVGWNSNWDKTYLLNRCMKIGVSTNFIRAGCRFLDIMQMYRYSVNRSRFSLSFVAKEFNEKKPYEYERMKNLSSDKVKERNIWDVEMTEKIDKKYKFSDLAIHLAQMSFLFPDEVMAERHDKNTVTPTPIHMAIIFSRARKYGYVIPSLRIREKQTYVGAYIHMPKHGLYENVIQYDFSSLYPNIMLGFKIAPFGREDVFLPLLKEYLEGKEKAKSDVDYMAYKLLANSYYGIFSSPYSRVYSPQSSEEIARRGREIIQYVINVMKEKGKNVIYADTDSIFILGSFEERKIYQDMINEAVKEKFGVDNIKIKFEGFWEKLLFPTSREGKSVKKRYAGILKYGKGDKEENSIEIVGLEHERGDWCEIAKIMQKKIIEMLLREGKEENVVEYVKNILSDVKRGKYDDLLVLSKSISKKLDEYKVNAQHVKALRDALSEGYVSEDFKQYGIIHYVICKGNKPKMVGATGGEEIDYDYYIRNQLKPIVSRLGIQLERNASIDTFF